MRHGTQGPPSATRSLRAALRSAEPMVIEKRLVSGCVRDDDHVFPRAWPGGLDTLAPHERRGRLCVELGQIAESVATLLLEDQGLNIFAQLTGPGTHGVDLLVLAPAGHVLAVEVKGTLRNGTLPRLGRGRLRQMSLEWLSSPDNPSMTEWDLVGGDVYGCVAILDFAAQCWRAVLTADFDHYIPVAGPSDLLVPPIADSSVE